MAAIRTPGLKAFISNPRVVAGLPLTLLLLLQGEEVAEDALWVVLKWEGLAPLILYPAAQQTSGIGLGRLFGGQGSEMRERARMLR